MYGDKEVAKKNTPLKPIMSAIEVTVELAPKDTEAGPTETSPLLLRANWKRSA